MTEQMEVRSSSSSALLGIKQRQCAPQCNAALQCLKEAVVNLIDVVNRTNFLLVRMEQVS